MKLDYSEINAILHLQEAIIEAQLINKSSATIDC